MQAGDYPQVSISPLSWFEKHVNLESIAVQQIKGQLIVNDTLRDRAWKNFLQFPPHKFQIRIVKLR